MMRSTDVIPGVDGESLAQLKAEVLVWAGQQIDKGYANAQPLSAHHALIARRVGVVNTGNIRLMGIEQLSRPDSSTLQTAMQQTGLLGPGTLGLALGYLVFVDPAFILHALGVIALPAATCQPYPVISTKPNCRREP